MSMAGAVLQQIRQWLGGYEQAMPGSAMPFHQRIESRRHRFYCGDPRDTGTGPRGFTFKATGYTLTFEALAEEVAGELSFQSFSIHLLNVGRVHLFFHKDPARANWPDHPEAHIQFDAPEDVERAAPFLGWRLPLGEVDLVRCLEYLVARGRQPASSIGEP